jgi:hypothetical protein
VLRIRACKGERDFSERDRDGSSLKNDRYIDRSFVGVAIPIVVFESFESVEVELFELRKLGF